MAAIVNIFWGADSQHYFHQHDAQRKNCIGMLKLGKQKHKIQRLICVLFKLLSNFYNLGRYMYMAGTEHNVLTWTQNSRLCMTFTLVTTVTYVYYLRIYVRIFTYGYVTFGLWPLTCDLWLVTFDLWPLTYDHVVTVVELVTKLLSY